MKIDPLQSVRALEESSHSGLDPECPDFMHQIKSDIEESVLAEESESDSPDELNFEGREPLKASSFLTFPFFNFIKPYINVAKKNGKITRRDVYPPEDVFKSSVTKAAMKETMAKVKAKKPTAGLLQIILSLNMEYLIPIIPLIFIYLAVANFIPPFILRRILDYVTATSLGFDADKAKALMWAGLLLLSQLIQGWNEGTFIHQLMKSGLRTQSGILSLLYEKITNLSDITRQATSTGNLINLLFVDSVRISYFLHYMVWFIMMPISIIGLVTYTVIVLGVAAWYGIIAILLLLPFVAKLGVSAFAIQKRLMLHRDARMKRVNELLNGIKVVKLFGSEEIQQLRIKGAREAELGSVFEMGKIMAGFTLFMNSATPIMALVSFSGYVLAGNELTPGVAFQTITLFSSLAFSFMMLPMIVSAFSEASISAARITAFLDLPEPDKKAIRREEHDPELPAIETLNAPSFSWGKATDTQLPKILDASFKTNMKKLKGMDKEKPACKARFDELMAAIGGDLTEDEQAAVATMETRYVASVKAQEAMRAAAAAAKEALKQQKKNRRRGAPQEEPAAEPEAEAEPAEVEVEAEAEVDADTGGNSETLDAICSRLDLPLVSAVDSLVKYQSYKYGRHDDDSPREELLRLLVHITVMMQLQKGSMGSTVAKDLPPALNELSLSVPAGHLLGVCGQVGCGKSSMFNALLGEMRLCSGGEGPVHPDTPAEGEEEVNQEDLEPTAVVLRGSIAYCPQAAWIFNATVRENILFGKEYDEERYQRVVDRCCLIPDLEQFDSGDRTMIGERGVTLSGGQKARIALARAVYSDADIYLLDDPLSAVDSHVGRRLFEDIIRGELATKTVILATHQTQYLPGCHAVAVMIDGRIAHQGTVAQLVEEGVEIEGIDLAAAMTVTDTTTRAHSREASEGDAGADADAPASPGQKVKSADTDARISTETKSSGRVSKRNYKEYLKNGGSKKFTVFLVALVLWQIFASSQTLYLSWWASNTVARTIWGHIGIYGALTLGIVIFSVTNTVLFLLFNINASRNLHNKMSWSVLRAPMSFFDTTPTGRILNRFSKDCDALDSTLMKFVLQSCTGGVTILFQIVIIISMSPVSLGFLIPLFVLFTIVFSAFRATMPELKRLDAMTKSPVLAFCSESLGGLPSIRAYARQSEFISKGETLINNNMATAWPTQCCGRWLSFRLQCMVAIVAGGCAFVAVMWAEKEIVALFAGLALTYAISLSYSFSQFVTNLVSAEGDFASVERVLEYSDLEPEAPLTGGTPLPTDWPKGGRLEVNGITLRYRDGLPLVLKGMDLSIQPGEKVGIVGRTGSGKSTTTAALFRLVELESGTITLDGVDISKIGLHDLRHNIAIIPQDAFLFSGTLRHNLDAAAQLAAETDDRTVETISDTVLWDALRMVQLADYFREQPGGLDAKIASNGDNLSAGQRQLVCLAKALIRNARLIVMDEASSSVDFETDQSIQRTIREAFADSTVLTIAHRLNTIVDYDRVCVLSEGLVAEFDTPANLLRSGGIFADLVSETGPVESETLRAVAFRKEAEMEG
eukprot:gnl/Dysnectes_brevis/456_a508_3886.p1 GENE.gnl/Dysnectes_brevis/456_a508_3886~~gnl/Dysnectes_brevis/456_a508_3886.p1  ORF type:complete len:1551 (+),score=641.49 gnl/Dysnectes_brevis/456_a508_3886:52-4704(+)